MTAENNFVVGPLLIRQQPFPVKLHEMLDSTSESTLESYVVSWGESGLSFTIHDMQEFEKCILPKYSSSQKKVSSFKRQLQYYGFTKEQDKEGGHCYFHENFQRNKRELCLTMISARVEREAAKKKRTESERSNDGNDNIIMRNKRCANSSTARPIQTNGCPFPSRTLMQTKIKKNKKRKKIPFDKNDVSVNKVKQEQLQSQPVVQQDNTQSLKSTFQQMDRCINKMSPRDKNSSTFSPVATLDFELHNLSTLFEGSTSSEVAA